MTVGYLRLDADRIILQTDDVSKRLLLRIADECENELICSKTAVNDGTLYLLWPDYGICGDDCQLKEHLKDLFEEENFELVFNE